ncbi:SCO4225 family membrane protein [Streptomyces sp. NPDC056528]|uniref:SCO4225 family membrane protein n=1 Tax=Streptomyces sp. NPDC056528 TaxID=3345854 RepID=UPI00368EDAE5
MLDGPHTPIAVAVLAAAAVIGYAVRDAQAPMAVRVALLRRRGSPRRTMEPPSTRRNRSVQEDPIMRDSRFRTLVRLTFANPASLVHLGLVAAAALPMVFASATADSGFAAVWVLFITAPTSLILLLPDFAKRSAWSGDPVTTSGARLPCSRSPGSPVERRRPRPRPPRSRRRDRC